MTFWKKLIRSKVSAISGRNSHCWQNFHNFKAEFYPLPELRLRPFLFCFVGCCLYSTTNYSFVQFDEGYFVFFMCIKLCSFQYYISKKLKNSDFEAKNKKRAEMASIAYGSGISNGHLSKRIRTNSYR